MARARATARHPQGWSYLVDQLAAAPDRAAFLQHMLDLQCKVVAAEYGAIWLRGEDGKLHQAHAWPAKLAQATDSPVAGVLEEAANAAFRKGSSHVLRLDRDGSAHAFVTVMKHGGEVEAVATVVAHCSDPQVIASTAAVREVAAGLYECFAAKHLAQQRHDESQEMRRAMAVLAVCQDGKNFSASCLNLVRQLARQFQCTRVSLGWVRGRHIKVIAVSDTENLQRHSQPIALTELAMAECLDQQQPVVCPVLADTEPLLAQAVVHAHRQLLRHDGQYALSIPLRRQEKLLGVLTFERSDAESAPFAANCVRQLQLIVDTVAPHLAERRAADRMLAVHAWNSFCRAASYLVGPQHVGWKIVVLLLAGVGMYGLLGTWHYTIAAPFTLEARFQRVVAAPFEGAVDGVHVERGQAVRAGQQLAALDTDELELMLDQAEKEKIEHVMKKQEAQAEPDPAKVDQMQARIEQVESQIELFEHYIEKATLLSPIDGDVLEGDWKDKIGTVVEAGQLMFIVAPVQATADLVAVLHIHEEDIDQLRAFMRTSSAEVTGNMVARIDPSRRYAIELQRIIPMAEPVNAVNGFVARCRIQGSTPESDAHQLFPGMEGMARLEVGRKPIRWILTHRIVDTLRLWLWK